MLVANRGLELKARNQVSGPQDHAGGGQEPAPRRCIRLRAPLTFILSSALLMVSAAAQNAPAATFTLPSGAEALEGPEQLEAGYHTFAFQNDSDTPVEIQLVRLKGDATVEASLAASRRVDEIAATGGDISAAFRRVNELIDFWGGANVGAGATARVGIPLESGSYSLSVASAGDAEEDIHRVDLVQTLEVTGGAGEPDSSADLTVEMVDFAFTLPENAAGGTQTWEFINRGEQTHHAVIQKVKPGKTLEDVMAFARTFEGEDPTEEFAYVHLLSPGSSNFVTLDLTPGTYILLCFLPDYAPGGDGAPHLAHGMMQAVTVTGE